MAGKTHGHHFLREWYQHYQDKTNQTLERFGHPKRIDIRSYEAQDIDKISTLHLWQKAHQQEQRGIQTIRGDYNRKVEAYNKELKDVKQQLESEKYKHEIERVKVEQQEKERQAGQGKEREEQPLSYIDRYRQATERWLVRDPQR